MSTHPKYCTALYAVSCLLDAVDGQAARALGQTSKFGAVLDMVTDRSVRGLHDDFYVQHPHGIYQVYDVLLALLPLLRLPELRHSFPIFDNSGFQQPLYAHV